MYPQHQQNRFRAWTGNPLIAVILAFLLSAQTAAAMPHSHPADHDPVMPEAVADHAAAGHHHNATDPERASDSGHPAGDRDCCEIECQDCVMGSCASMTQSRGPGLFSEDRDIRFSSLDSLTVQPMIGGLYRPPISR